MKRKRDWEWLEPCIFILTMLLGVAFLLWWGSFVGLYTFID